MQRLADVRNAAAVLQWDQETYLPPAAAGARARQLATLSTLVHEQFTSDEFGKLLQKTAAIDNLSPLERRNIDESLYQYNRQTKLTSEFVRKLSEAISTAFHAWIEARKQNNFRLYEPALTALVNLKLEEADLRGYEAHPYNAMLEEYERSASVASLDAIFGSIKQPLRELIDYAGTKPWPDTSFLYQHYPKNDQWNWSMFLIESLGFDLKAGRQDLAEHPFSVAFAPTDVRITTRINEHDFANMTWSCIHETGHALYEQGLPMDEYGLPCGEYASLSIHESQSRIWENCIGRNKPFWTHYLPLLKTYFPKQLGDVDLRRFVQAVNKVQPSLVRTEADELTYHFHVIIRYEIEKMFLNGDLKVGDLPAVWNELYKKYLGLEVPDDKNGCLQDVHWSHGSFGYFPTYSLGSFYAAQLYLAAKEQLPGMDEKIAKGDTREMLNWLRDNIHRYGKQYDSEELILKATGTKLSPDMFIKYYREKLDLLFS